MKKIPSLFKRNYGGDRLVRNEVVPGSEWVLNGEGVATLKIDGTACMVRDGKLYRRFDRRPTKTASRQMKYDAEFVLTDSDMKPAPDGWEPCEPLPDSHTGHWPGWVPVGDGPDDQWHREAFENRMLSMMLTGKHEVSNGTYELVGPKIQGNPYDLDEHDLFPHGHAILVGVDDPGRTFLSIRDWCEHHPNIEGIVWHHPNGRMVKIKRKDFGLPWPVKGGAE